MTSDGIDNVENYTIHSKSNFWVPSISNSYFFFPIKIYGKDSQQVTVDALQLSAVSPLFQHIVHDAFLACQCSWTSDNISVIFTETDSSAVHNFVSYITHGICSSWSSDDIDQVKFILKDLLIDCMLDIEDDTKDASHFLDEVKEENHCSDDDYVPPNFSPNHTNSEIKENIEDKPLKPTSNSDVKLTCQECNIDISGDANSWDYMLHMSTHIGDKARECPHCKFILRNRKDWKNHLGGETGEKKRKICCGICGDVFVGQWKFMVHNHDKHNGKPPQCETCHQVYPSFDAWRSHRFAHETTICPICGTSISKSGLHTHIKLQHLTGPDDSKPCTICGKMFPSDHSRKIHEKVVHSEARICSFCGKTLKSALTLKMHINVVHEGKSKTKDLEKTQMCRICGKAFKTRYDLRKHEVRHENDGNYKCEFCDKTFGNKLRLRAHINTTHNKFRFECLVCGKQLVVISKAKQHCLQHNPAKIKSYQCEVCLEWFENRDYGATHIKHFHLDDKTKPTIRHVMTDEFQGLYKSVIREIT